MNIAQTPGARIEIRGSRFGADKAALAVAFTPSLQDTKLVSAHDNLLVVEAKGLTSLTSGSTIRAHVSHLTRGNSGSVVVATVTAFSAAPVVSTSTSVIRSTSPASGCGSTIPDSFCASAGVPAGCLCVAGTGIQNHCGNWNRADGNAWAGEFGFGWCMVTSKCPNYKVTTNYKYVSCTGSAALSLHSRKCGPCVVGSRSCG